VPVTKKVAAMPYFSENQFYRISSESIPFGSSLPKTSGWGVVTDSLTPKLLQQALMGQISAQEMVRQINDELAKDTPPK
jgi:ABC-type glycerol-3-phosphate transport system substrate-binding protein